MLNAFFHVVAALIFAIGGLAYLMAFPNVGIGSKILVGVFSAIGFAELTYFAWKALRQKSANSASRAERDETP